MKIKTKRHIVNIKEERKQEKEKCFYRKFLKYGNFFGRFKTNRSVCN
jgi:hypothetical protein